MIPENDKKTNKWTIPKTKKHKFYKNKQFAKVKKTSKKFITQSYSNLIDILI